MGLTNVISYVIFLTMTDQFFELYKELQKVTNQMFEMAGDNSEKQKKVIAGKIKGYRLFHKLTQENLANKLRVTKMAIIRWENEKCMPSELAQDKMKQEGIL